MRTNKSLIKQRKSTQQRNQERSTLKYNNKNRAAIKGDWGRRKTEHNERYKIERMRAKRQQKCEITDKKSGRKKKLALKN